MVLPPQLDPRFGEASSLRRRTILIMDDDAAVRQSYADYLEDRQFTVLSAANGREGLERFASAKVDLVLVDLRMPEVDGFSVLAALQKADPDLPTIAISGTGLVRDAIEALKCGAWDFLLKPIEEFSILDHAIAKAFEKADLLRENRDYQALLEQRVIERTQALQQVNERLLKSEERHRVIYECSHDGIFIYDPWQDTCTDCNPAGVTLFELPSREAIGLLSKTSIFSKTQDEGQSALAHFNGHIETALASGYASGEMRFSTINGGAFWGFATFTRVEIGGSILVQINIRDIRGQKKAEEAQAAAMDALRVAKETAEDANRAKDEFLAVMSHEMRTPLNPILGLSELMRETLTEEPESTYIETIIRSANRQLELIDNILSYIRIDRGNLELRMEHFKPVQLCKMALEDAQHAAEGLGLKFVNGGEAGEPLSASLTVRGEQSMIQRVLDNLLGNACKYTDAGRVVLSVGQRGGVGEDGLARFRFVVEDSGIGIDPVQQERLFEPFTQADSSHTRRFEGAGLGLAICRKLVDALGGSIGLESQPGVGSKFFFEIPLEIRVRSDLPEDRTPVPFNQRFCRSCRVLLVDDARDNQRIAQILLERMGAEVSLASNGLEAVNACSESGYDIVLMDLAMPVMGGLEATRQIRSTCPYNRDTPVVAVTADANTAIRERCLAAGMNEYLTKPLNRVALYDVLNGFLSRGLK